MSSPQSNDQRNGNDMAFPCLDTAYTPNGTVQVGLTKRELFAAMAMQAVLTGAVTRGTPSIEWFDMGTAVSVADALLAALDQSHGS